MFDDRPLVPSEAAIDTSPDPLAAYETWLRLKRQELEASLLSRRLETMCTCSGSFRSKPHACHRPRNTRVRLVQARRKAMGLSQDGKCCGLRSRKASYAFRLAEQRFYDYYLIPGIIPPRVRDFEHVPARRRKRDTRSHLRWKLLPYSDEERAWMAMRDANACEICTAFALSTPVIGELSTINVDNFDALAVPDTQESEHRNG